MWDVSVKLAAAHTHTHSIFKHTKTNCLAKQMELKIGKEPQIKNETEKKVQCEMQSKKTAREMQSLFLRKSSKFDCFCFMHVVNVRIQCTQGIIWGSKLFLKNISNFVYAMPMYAVYGVLCVHLSDYTFVANLF